MCGGQIGIGKYVGGDVSNLFASHSFISVGAIRYWLYSLRGQYDCVPFSHILNILNAR